MRIHRGVLSAALLTVAASGPVRSDTPERPREVYHHVTHLGWVVRDAAAAAAAWKALGVREISEPRDQQVTLRTANGDSTLKVRQLVARLGALRVDWIEPLDASGPYRAFLDQHGEGVHHLGYTLPDAAALDAEVASFTARGAAPVATGSMAGAGGERRFAWLGTASAGGLTVALESGAQPPGPAGTAGNEPPFDRVTQFAFVVRDVAAVSRQLERFGFPALRIEPNISLDRVYRESPGTFEMLLGWDRSGDVAFEWIQPTRGPSVYHEYLTAHGEGYHHLGFNVTDMDATLARLKAAGLAVTMSGGWNVNGHEGRFAYLDADRFGGVTIELLWNKPGT